MIYLSGDVGGAVLEEQLHQRVHSRRVLDTEQRDQLPHQMVNLELMVCTHGLVPVARDILQEIEIMEIVRGVVNFKISYFPASCASLI